MKKLNQIFPIIGLFVLASACDNVQNESIDPEDIQYQYTNDWIRAYMDYFYYWNENVPDLAPGDVVPENFYNSLLEPEDIFSGIHEGAQDYLDGLQGSEFTAGYSPAFGLFSGTDQVFIIVEFVFPDTPAEEAGIARGDIILEINGEILTTSNYLDLYYYDAGSSTYTLGTYNSETGDINYAGSVTLTKEEIDLDPIVMTEVFEIDDHKVGYMFYSNFRDGSNSAFLTSMDNVFLDFVDQGITDLIIDLRYNPGGTLSSAINMTSMIVPSNHAIAEDLLIEYEYNAELEAEIIEDFGPDSEYLVARFSSNPVTSIGLDRAYFLTSDVSASASELVITGLEPYMEVYNIGDNSFGKYYGSFVLSGLDVDPPVDYVITPVSFKYKNAQGITDFKDGLVPDYYALEDLLDPFPLGDVQDPLIATAIEHITTGSVITKHTIFQKPYRILPDPIEISKSTVFLPEIPRN